MDKSWWTARVRKEDVLQTVEEEWNMLQPREGDKRHMK
jgi:hypothetical protein